MRDRFSRRRLVILLLPAALYLLAPASLASTALAATLKVNTTTDETTPGDHLCSLREAIATVNAPGTKTDCGTADSTSNTIILPAGHYTLSIPPAGADDNSSGDLNVIGTAPLTIRGAGQSATKIDASSLSDRVLSVAAGATVTLERLTITGGHAPNGAHGANGTPAAGSGFGGILNLGNLTLTRVVVTNNSAGQGGGGGGGSAGHSYGGAGGAGGAGGSGGGIYSSGTLTLSHVSATNNSAGQGGTGGHGGAATLWLDAVYRGGAGGSGGTGGAGGAVYNAGPAASVTITSSTISGSASGTGGAGGTGGSACCFPTRYSSLGGGGGAGGSGGADGGAVANSGGTVVLTGSTIVSNTAGNGGSGGNGGDGSFVGDGGSGGPGGLGSSGGGIWSEGGSLSATNGTLSSDGAGAGGNGGAGIKGGGGDVLGGPGGNGGDGGDGGAIEVTKGASTLVNVTVDSSQAGPGGSGGLAGGSVGSDGLGGGLYVQSATSSDDMSVQNTIVAASARGANCAGSEPSAITDGGHNLSFPDNTCPGINADPKLLTLNNYGGPTQTLALGTGSAAIDQVPATGAGCPATDQRGVKRPQGSACDIGAFEFTTPAVTITTPADGARYHKGQHVLAAYNCSEGGIRSPIATCRGTVKNGRPIDTSTPSTHAFTVTATDKAGNKTTTTTHYTVTRSR